MRPGDPVHGPLFRKIRRRTQRGFTLIELLIAIGIVAVLTTIALPAWQEQVRRSQRAAAGAVLLDVAARQRQFVLDRRVYAPSLAELAYTVPADVATRYTVSIEAPADARPPVFAIVATPRGAMLGDRCGVLRLDDTGARTPSGCW